MPNGDAKEGYLNTNAHLEAKVALLMAQLAESQARELRLREALDNVAWHRHPSERPNQLVEKLERIALDGLALPQDDSALREMIAAERASCIEDARTVGGPFAVECETLIRARGGKP